MNARDILDPRRVVLDLGGTTKREIIEQLSRTVIDTHPEIDLDVLVDALVAREEASSTAIADGIAIPHGKVALGEEVIAAFGRSRSGLGFESIDGSPTHLFFLLVSPDDHPSLHLRWLAHLAVLLKNPALRTSLREADTILEIFENLEKEERTLSEAQ